MPCSLGWEGQTLQSDRLGWTFGPAASYSCGTLVKFLTYSEPLFPLLCDGHNNESHHTGLL